MGGRTPGSAVRKPRKVGYSAYTASPIGQRSREADGGAPRAGASARALADRVDCILRRGTSSRDALNQGNRARRHTSRSARRR